MGLFGGDNEIGNLLQDAVKIKSAQMGQKRRTYETWPYFVQHTLFHGEKEDIKAWRQLPFPEKIVQAEKIKEEGNAIYAKGNWSDAADKYEESASLVHYCYSTDPGWRKNQRGIDDDVLVLVEDFGSTEEEKKQQIKLRLQCCLNLGACKLQLEKYDEVVAACDVALELEPRNVKALYRRAEARVRPSKSTGYDHDLAIKDLALAASVDPENKHVSRLLKDLRAERKIQQGKDRQNFGGMFERGSMYDDKQESAMASSAGAEGNSASSSSGEVSLRPEWEPGPEPDLKTLQSRIDNVSDEDSLEKRMQDAELLRDLYMRNGKEDEAKELNEKIQMAKKAIKEREKPVEERERPRLDWDNPTEEMIEDARKHGLDLRDPVVVQELKRLERDGLDNAPQEGSAGEPAAPGGASEAAPEVDLSAPLPWGRYVALFLVMVIIWRLLDAGFLRNPAKVSRLAFQGFLQFLGLAAVEGDAESELGGPFAAIYKAATGLFGGDDYDL